MVAGFVQLFTLSFSGSKVGDHFVVTLKRTNKKQCSLFTRSQITFDKFHSLFQSLCGVPGREAMEKYSEVGRIGANPKSTVFKVRNNEDGMFYAMKKTPKYKIESPEAKRQIRNEIRALSLVKNPKVIELVEFFETEREFCRVFELFEGETLFEAMILKKEGFGLKETNKIFLGIIEALDTIHELGVVHRNVNLDNVMFCRMGEEVHVVLINFGMSGFLNGDLCRKQCGTPGFMAPELIRGEKYTTKVDIFSASVIYYMMYSLLFQT